MVRTTTVSLEDRAEEIRADEVAHREQMLDEMREEVLEEYDQPWEIPEKINQRYTSLQEEIKRLRGQANLMEETAEAIDGAEFEIRELSAGGVAAVQDDVMEASDVTLDGDGTPKAGYAKLRALDVAVVEMPPGVDDVEDLPDPVSDWLYDCVDEFNSTGEVDLGNSSLRAEMLNSES